MSSLDTLLGAEVTQLDAIVYGAEVRAALAQTDVVAPTWHGARRHRSWRRAQFCTKNWFSLVWRRAVLTRRHILRRRAKGPKMTLKFSKVQT
jgi:hypothetical protein